MRISLKSIDTPLVFAMEKSSSAQLYSPSSMISGQKLHWRWLVVPVSVHVNDDFIFVPNG